MASIRQRANGHSVLWREDGAQRSQWFPSKREAEAFRYKLKRGTAETARTTGAAMPFGEFVTKQYLPNARLSPNTKRDTGYVLNSQLSALTSRPLSWVASHRAEVQDILSASPRADNGLAYSTVKRSCDEAVSLGWIPSHRLAGMVVRRSTKRREIIPTTPSQRQAFADGLGRDGLAVWVMHGTGMRAGECLGLKGSDFRDGFATVRVSRQAQHGHSAPLKARRDGAYRDVPVPAWLAARVRAHVAQTGTGPLFPGNVAEFVRYRGVAEKIKATADAIGLPGFTCHQFRHAFATELLAAGIPVTDVAAFLGDGVKVVTETYAHVTPAASDRARAILDQMAA